MKSATSFLTLLPTILSLLATGLTAAPLSAKEGPTTFERVFGVSGTLDSAMVERVKALPPGERLLVDTDHDGTHDEVWFIDTAVRHTDARRPLLVRVIDEDGDLDTSGPDLDSDLYLADWNYDQKSCQYRSHFSGDEVFYQFELKGQGNEWGIDALHVGKTSGLGGLTLIRGERAWPVQNRAGKGNIHFEKRILAQGPIRAAIEFTADHIVPGEPELEVRTQCVIYAGHQETEIRAHVTGAGLLAPGIVHLPRETTFQNAEAGYFGTWGWQEDAIGQIGMGVIVLPKSIARVDDLSDERRIGCRTTMDGRLRYWTIGDWRRGRQYPIGPTVTNWQQELQTLSQLLLTEVRITLGQPEEIE